MTRKRLLLIGWDSADWKIIHPLVDAGLMPAMARMLDKGVAGNLTTLEPQLSPMLWTSFATHGELPNGCLVSNLYNSRKHAEADFDLYQGVVAAAYRLHDLFLVALMRLAGPDTALMLVSDHGVHSDPLRPKFTPRVPAGITIWHRPQGIFAAMGPGFQQDSLIHGARLLDVAPTVLAWFGLPVGEDMDGRVLADAFNTPPDLTTVPSWEDPHAAPRQVQELPRADQQALLDQFADLGYIERVSEDPGQAVRETERENKWNLARASSSRHSARSPRSFPPHCLGGGWVLMDK